MAEKFTALPQPETADGTPRRTGVEIEFAGLDEGAAARIVVRTLGGAARQTDSAIWQVADTVIGTVDVYLDIFLRDAEKTRLRDAVLEAGRDLVPVEVVTEPLLRDGLLELERLRAALCAAGARGSGAGALYGFGVHLNPELVSPDVAGTLPVLLAYGLIEDWLRAAAPINATRRLLPFTDPYPKDLIDALVALGPSPSIEAVIDAYLEHAASRNFGLDMLPAFAQIDPDRVRARIGPKQAARPTFHFRLPDCLIDDPGWTLDQPWRLWHRVESVAADADLLLDLTEAWRRHHARLPFARPDWAGVAGNVLSRRPAHLAVP